MYLKNTERVSILSKQSTTNAFLYNKLTQFQHLSMCFSRWSHMTNLYGIILKYLWYDVIFEHSGFDQIIQLWILSLPLSCLLAKKFIHVLVLSIKVNGSAKGSYSISKCVYVKPHNFTCDYGNNLQFGHNIQSKIFWNLWFQCSYSADVWQGNFKSFMWLFFGGRSISL